MRRGIAVTDVHYGLLPQSIEAAEGIARLRGADRKPA